MKWRSVPREEPRDALLLAVEVDLVEIQDPGSKRPVVIDFTDKILPSPEDADGDLALADGDLLEQTKVVALILRERSAVRVEVQVGNVNMLEDVCP